MRQGIFPWDENTTIKIILADDHHLMRQGLRSLLATEPDIKVMAEADNGRTAVRLVQEHKPDVVIMDIAMPDLNGIEVTRQIMTEFPRTKVIALSMHFGNIFVLNMLKAGAAGYLLKDCAVAKLVKAIRTVVDEKTYLSPGVSDIVFRELLNRWTHTDSEAFSILTVREREVLQLLAEGKTNKQIAH